MMRRMHTTTFDPVLVVTSETAGKGREVHEGPSLNYIFEFQISEMSKPNRTDLCSRPIPRPGPFTLTAFSGAEQVIFQHAVISSTIRSLLGSRTTLRLPIDHPPWPCVRQSSLASAGLYPISR